LPVAAASHLHLIRSRRAWLRRHDERQLYAGYYFDYRHSPILPSIIIIFNTYRFTINIIDQ